MIIEAIRLIVLNRFITDEDYSHAIPLLYIQSHPIARSIN